jgi:hypothetical protein
MEHVMTDEDELLLLLLLLRRRQMATERRRRVWVREIFQRRQQQGDYHQLLQEIRLSDPESHFR